MGEVAYTVRADHAGFEGGALAVADDTFELGEALKAGAGYVIVDESDLHLTTRLDEQPALRRVSADEARRAIDSASRGLEKMTRDELEALAADMTLDLDSIEPSGPGGKLTNADIVGAIRDARGEV